MKGMGILELMTMLLLRRLDVPLRRDVVFIACADEEVGGEMGIEWLNREHAELLDAEYVINEGAYGSTEMFGLTRPVFSCSLGEKGPLWLRLRAQGRPGHASVPHDDNALERLVRALDKVLRWRRPITLLPELRPMFEWLIQAGVFKSDLSEESLTALADKMALVKALLSDTISVTMCSAGVKGNNSCGGRRLITASFLQRAISSRRS
jgi:acetylornithine deacetylase/succinyl-diaminopimelate desuccinylase-like protein